MRFIQYSLLSISIVPSHPHGQDGKRQCCGRSDPSGNITMMFVPILVSAFFPISIIGQLRFGSPENLYNSCIVDICGRPPDFISLFDRQDTGEFLFPPRDARLLEEARVWLSHKIRNYFELPSWNTFDHRQLENMLDATLRIKRDGIDEHVKEIPLEIFFVDVMIVMGNHRKRQDGTIFIDRTFLKSIDDNNRKERFAYLAEEVESYYEDRDKHKDILHANHKVFFATRYPDITDTREAIGHHLQRLSDTAERAKRVSLATYNLVKVDLELFSRRFAEGRLSIQELYMLLEEDATLNLLSIVLDYRDRYHDSLREELRERMGAWITESSEQRLRTALSTLDSQWISAGEYAEKACLDELEKNFSSLPHPYQKASLRSVAEEAKTEFLEQLDIFVGLSAASRQTIRHDLQNTTILLPLTFAEWVGIVFEHIDYFTKALKENREHVERNFSTEEYAISTIVLNLYTLGGRRAQGAKSTLSTLCQRFRKKDLRVVHFHPSTTFGLPSIPHRCLRSTRKVLSSTK